MDMREARVGLLRFFHSRSLAVKQAHDVADIVLKRRQRCLDSDFHAFASCSQAIFVFMPWPG